MSGARLEDLIMSHDGFAFVACQPCTEQYDMGIQQHVMYYSMGGWRPSDERLHKATHERRGQVIYGICPKDRAVLIEKYKCFDGDLK